MKDTINHEYGHAIVKFLRNKPNEIINGRRAEDIYQEIFANGKRLLNEADEAIQKAFEYPFDILKTKKYGSEILSDEKAAEVAQEEVFAEAMRYYENGELYTMPSYYQETMQFIFNNGNEIKKKAIDETTKRRWKHFELTGEDLKNWLNEMDEYNKRFPSR